MRFLRARIIVFLFLPLLLPVFFMAGCTSTAPVVLPGELPLGLEKGRPSWINDYPAESGFYTGIGSSNTGDRGEDMEIARAKALVNLASSISTEIRSELLITTGESSTGEVYDTVDQVITETVNTNIREIEVVDSWYSPSDGYWFYLRLNKSVWESIQREEADRLSRRVLGLLDPVLADGETSIAARLRALSKGWVLLAESPYSGLIEASLQGRRGVLIDLVENQITSYVDSLYLEVLTGTGRIRPGRPVPLTVTVKSMYPIPPGAFTVDLLLSEETGSPVSVTTDSKGIYSGVIRIPSMELGTRRVRASLVWKNIGLDPDRIRLPVLEAEGAFEVSAISIHLDVKGSEDLGAVNATGAFASLISSLLPVELTGPAEAEYSISVELATRSAPPNDYGITMAYLKAFVSVTRDGKILESYQSPEIKEGGLDLSQAYTRGFNKLVESFRNSPGFAKALETALF